MMRSLLYEFGVAINELWIWHANGNADDDSRHLLNIKLELGLAQLMGEENDEEEEDENLKTEHFDVNNERMEMEIWRWAHTSMQLINIYWNICKRKRSGHCLLMHRNVNGVHLPSHQFIRTRIRFERIN